MRIISLSSAQPGMVLGRSVFGSEGQILLKAGVEIKPQYISYLKRLGLHCIYVKDSRMGEGVDDVVREEVRLEARSLMKKVIKSIKGAGRAGKGFSIQDQQVLSIVVKILEDLLQNGDLVIQLADLRSKDDYLFAHSVQCSIMATLVAKKKGYDEETLKALATGALLHDLGMAFVPDSILQKQGELTKDEFDTIKTHPVLGFEAFKKSSLFSSKAGSIILHHHERINGKGYPKGLSGDKIHPLAMITAIADMYDALTSYRPYREAFKPHEAIELLQGIGYDLFHLQILKEFLSVIAAYPVGSHVALSNGESGLVVSNKPGYTLRPTVKVLYVGEDLAPHPAPYELDLSVAMDCTIVDVLP